MSINFLRGFSHTPRVSFVNVGDAVMSQRNVFEKFAKNRRVNLRIAQNEYSAKGMDSYSILVSKPSNKGDQRCSLLFAPKGEAIETLMAKLVERVHMATEWVRPISKIKEFFMALFKTC